MARQGQNLYSEAGQKPIFHLYTSGATPGSIKAITNLKSILDSLFVAAYELKVTDVYQEPQVAIAAEVHATPTLIREHPAPAVRISGDFSGETIDQSLFVTLVPKETPGE